MTIICRTRAPLPTHLANLQLPTTLSKVAKACLQVVLKLESNHGPFNIWHSPLVTFDIISEASTQAELKVDPDAKKQNNTYLMKKWEAFGSPKSVVWQLFWVVLHWLSATEVTLIMPIEHWLGCLQKCQWHKSWRFEEEVGIMRKCWRRRRGLWEMLWLLEHLAVLIIHV